MSENNNPAERAAPVAHATILASNPAVWRVSWQSWELHRFGTPKPRVHNQDFTSLAAAKVYREALPPGLTEPHVSAVHPKPAQRSTLIRSLLCQE